MANSLNESSSQLINLAKEVLKSYNINSNDISIIQSGTIKTVWKIKYNNSLLCLKRLRQSYDKASFSVNAQIYIKSKGGNVPGILLTVDKKAILQYNDELFVLYEWMDGRELNFNNNSDLAYAIKGLAAFHLTSKGYTPDASYRISSKINKWPNQYESMGNKLKKWKEDAYNRKSSNPYFSYIQTVDSMLVLSDNAQRLIAASHYNELSANNESQVLCHQDYGTGNALLGKNGVIILDLDGVTLDFPMRDLRKLIFKYEEPFGKWQSKMLSDIVDWYSEINPLSLEEKEILYIDLLFPHRFYGLVKNIFISEKPIKASDIERIAIFEESKLKLLKELL
ncbi:CotS family spore coat protein [Candidatus Clostridium radicumherbarum]|uniref:CotS family spore coat protein n=1 Tax=Candidatus Clostridium radicumherbarum TaxID=3381662 RepID=A0ABW8TXC2_9CLOT